jgi:hypothetical protein
MMSILNIRKRFLPALAAALLAAGCSTPPPPPPPVAALPPPPPAIALSNSVLQSAANYQAYMNGVAAIKADFKSGQDVAQSLRQGDRYDPQALLQGAIAYSAVVALQDQAFVGSLRTFAADPDSREQMTRQIIADPNYVTAIKGADTAAGLIIATLMDQGRKVEAAGEAVKQSAYDIQHQAWSKELVADRDQRLADAKSTVGMEMLSSSDDVTLLHQEAVGAQPMALTGQAATPPFPPVVVRALAVAALAALGQAGDDNIALVKPIMADQASGACLNMAKLNLYQCLAVSRPHYEDVFCLGQHVMMDTGQCVEYAAGAPVPVVQPLAVSKTEISYGAKTPAKKHAKKKSSHATSAST